MRNLTTIVAVNQDGVIGAGNTLPWRIRTDLRFFREQTINNVVIMGRKTYDSLGGPLKDRLNIVVTHGFGLFQQTKECLVAHSITEAIAIADMKKSKRQEVFVIGGATMYTQFSPYVDRYLMTDVEKSVPEGDTFFSKDLLGRVDDWQVHSILKGDATAVGDEVPFRTFELKAKEPRQYEMRRETAINEYRSRSHMGSARAVRRPSVEEARMIA